MVNIAKDLPKTGRSAAYHKKGLWANKHPKGVKPAAKPAAAKRAPTKFEAQAAPKKLHSTKGLHAAKLRASITPGTVLIVLAGKYAGKRVVFLKQLESGLLLVTGPFKLNGVPLRRIGQAYVIATSTKINIGSVDASAINDAYFTKPKAAKAAGKSADDLFAKKKAAPKAAVSSDRIKDQKKIDDALLKVVKSVPLLPEYLASRFRLTNGQFPHNMKF